MGHASIRTEAVTSRAPVAVNQDVRFHLSREAKRKIYSATITTVIVVLTVGQQHAGFLLVLGVVPLLVWLTWSAWVIVRRPYAHLGQLICLAVWNTFAYDFEKDIWVYESWAEKKKFLDTRPPGTK